MKECNPEYKSHQSAGAKKPVLQPQQSTLCVGSICMGLNFYFAEFRGEEVPVHCPLSVSVFLASPVFQVFTLLMVSPFGLSCVLGLVFRELRRKSVSNYLTVKCINNALTFCAWASLGNAYAKLLEKFFLCHIGIFLLCPGIASALIKF